MFGPIYHAAARVGIAAAQLDQSELHVVAMMINAPTTPEEIAQRETIAIMQAKMAAKREGRSFDVLEVVT